MRKFLLALVMLMMIPGMPWAGLPAEALAQGEYCAPFAKAKEVALKMPVDVRGCYVWKAEAEGITYKAIYCPGDSVGLIAEMGSDARGVGYSDVYNQFLVLEEGFVRPIPKEQAVDIAFQFFRKLVAKRLL